MPSSVNAPIVPTSSTLNNITDEPLPVPFVTFAAKRHAMKISMANALAAADETTHAALPSVVSHFVY